MPDPSASEQIDAIVRDLGGWRGRRLAELRAVINEADPGLVEEVKWKKPSNPAGVPVWSRDGIVCVADALKNAVRLTFPKGAAVRRSAALFNARLDGNAARAIDFNETDAVDAGALTALINEAVALNTAKARKA
jgi:hypothetical protein